MSPGSENTKGIAVRLAIGGGVVALALAVPSVVRVANGNADAHAAPSASSAGGERGPGASPIEAIATQDGAQDADAIAHATVASMRSTYDPGQPLLAQMDRLKTLADRGDPYATCVLGQALDSCVRHMDRGRGDDNPLGLAPEDSRLTGDETQLDAVSGVLGSYDRTERMCAGLGQGALQQRDERLFRSAMMGHPRAMARFALDPVGMNNISLAELDRMLEYRRSAASMLDRAAIAGVPEAIRGVYRAYSTGGIATTVGDVDVGRDAAKAVAAARVLLLFVDGEEKQRIEQDAAAMLAGLDPPARERAAELEAAYRNAYLGYRRGGGDGGRLSDLREPPPEQICSGATAGGVAGIRPAGPPGA